MNIISQYDLHILLSNLDFFMKKKIKITKEFLDTFKDDTEEDLSWLIGYSIKQKVDGGHRNDGQMVDYTFTFINPQKKETVLETEMCLMVGWNFPNEKYKIK